MYCLSQCTQKTGPSSTWPPLPVLQRGMCGNSRRLLVLLELWLESYHSHNGNVAQQDRLGTCLRCLRSSHCILHPAEMSLRIGNGRFIRFIKGWLTYTYLTVIRKQGDGTVTHTLTSNPCKQMLCSTDSADVFSEAWSNLPALQ